MANLLIPGRHIVTSVFMEKYLHTILNDGFSEVDTLGEWKEANAIDRIIIPITSANQHGSRYNPVPLYARVVGLERTLAPFRESHNIHITYVPVPHMTHSEDFAGLTLKYVSAHTKTPLSPADTIVWSSTASVIAQYQEHGFTILPAEWNPETEKYEHIPPTRIIEAVAKTKEYSKSEHFHLLSEATQSLWRDMPEIPEHIFRLWHDPLLTTEGSLTEDRDYKVYTNGMSHSVLMDVKYADIKDAIVEGKIVEEGCADGALMVRLAESFPDSDIIGLDITGEFISRVEERQRAGEFGNSFVHAYQRNILEPVFAEDSIQTTICNSTLHELWSYGNQEVSVRKYLNDKFAQLASGGRLVIRDVVGPENKEDEVYVKFNSLDGLQVAVGDQETLLNTDTAKLSTESRFYRFAHDFLRDMRKSKRRDKTSKIQFSIEEIDNVSYVKLKLKDLVEYLSRKDFHDNWNSEMNEEFAFWDIKEWKQELSNAGFTIIHDDSRERRFSRAYVNEWIVKNRWQSSVTIFKKIRNVLVEQQYPVTNMVLVGEKPLKSI